MVAVIAHAEAALDQVGDALRGPQVALPSVGACPPEQQRGEALSLFVGEFGFGARVWPGVEAAWSLALDSLSPSVHGALVDAEAACHLGLGESVIEQAHGPPSTALEFVGGSVGSHGDQGAHRLWRSCRFLAFSVQRSVRPKSMRFHSMNASANSLNDPSMFPSRACSPRLLKKKPQTVTAVNSAMIPYTAD